MPEVNNRAAAYGKASRHYNETLIQVNQLRSQLTQAEEVLRRADMERTRTRCELLEEAAHY